MANMDTDKICLCIKIKSSHLSSSTIAIAFLWAESHSTRLDFGASHAIVLVNEIAEREQQGASSKTIC